MTCEWHLSVTGVTCEWRLSDAWVTCDRRVDDKCHLNEYLSENCESQLLVAGMRYHVVMKDVHRSIFLVIKAFLCDHFFVS